MTVLHPSSATPQSREVAASERRSRPRRRLPWLQRHVHPRRQVPGTVAVFVLGAVVGAVASWWTVRAGTNLDYGDAMAHLTIAQRITDSRAPGLSQLGTVWLPLPHLLLLPLVQVGGESEAGDRQLASHFLAKSLAGGAVERLQLVRPLLPLLACTKKTR